jgi:class 3 adenylate cyclase
VQKYVYDIFGPAVDIAARMGQLAEPTQIVVCAETAALLQDGFVCRPRGSAEIEGFGTKELWTLVDEAGAPAGQPPP